MSGYRGGIFKCPFYSRRYCANEEWRHCPIARALALHYERTENR